MIPKMDSTRTAKVQETGPIILSISAANATNAITEAAIIRISFPADKMESPKKEKNGSFSLVFDLYNRVLFRVRIRDRV